LKSFTLKRGSVRLTYCRKCGTKLNETARFCYSCGTPVIVATAETKPATPRRKRPVYFLPVAILLAIVLTALILSALFFLPVYPVHFSQTDQVAKADVDNLFVDFQADVANVNIFFKNLPNNMVELNVTADGAVSIFEDPSTPLNVTVEHQITNNSAVVIASVSHITRRSIWNSLGVNCDVYIDPSANVSLAFRSSVGKIMMDADAYSALENIDLQTTTGSVYVSLSKDVTVAGVIALKSTTGTVQFRMDEADVSDNVQINLRTTTGSVNADLRATQQLSANVTVNAQTTTGGVNLFMSIDSDVGARIESETGVGGIEVDVQRFSGEKTPLESNNFPARSNFIVSLRTTTGGININAVYGSSTSLN
jgi:hypothetical protein